MTNCRACGSSNIWPFLDLGNQAIPRFPHISGEKVPHYPLKLVKCETCSLVQLSESVDRDLLFKQFWYQSGISEKILQDLKSIAEQGAREVSYEGNALDIGCNDGSLLRYLPNGMPKIGFEPAENVAKIADQYGHIIHDYFKADTYNRLFEKAKLVTAIAMFYDLENPARFCREVAECLDQKGVLIIQQNYLPLMLKNTSYDNICHEHLTYFSLKSLKPMLENVGLEVYDVETNNINGGSFKTFISHKAKRFIHKSVTELEEEENDLDLSGRKVYRDFAYRVRMRGLELNRFLRDHGEKTMLYGAGTRGATIFQYSTSFSRARVIAAVDNNPEKHGHYYLDTQIPIISPNKALQNRPTYFLLLPYHLAEEIIVKERRQFPESKWVIPLPEFRIV